MSQAVRNWIHDGLEVAHTDNLQQKMFVSRLVFEPWIDKEKSQGRQMKIKGVEVHWWESTATGMVFRTHIFHTHQLVPWHIACEGEQQVSRWRQSSGACNSR